MIITVVILQYVILEHRVEKSHPAFIAGSVATATLMKHETMIFRTTSRARALFQEFFREQTGCLVDVGDVVLHAGIPHGHSLEMHVTGREICAIISIAHVDPAFDF
jgi:hypothetical protein